MSDSDADDDAQEEAGFEPLENMWKESGQNIFLKSEMVPAFDAKGTPILDKEIGEQKKKKKP